MSYCNYSIVPKPGKYITCSKCGKKIEDLPYYNQLVRMYTCIRREGSTSFYVGLGVGVPMCEECDDAVDETIEKTHEQSRNMYLVVSIVAMVMIGILRGVEANVGFVLFMVAVFVGIVLLINQHLKEKQSKLNDMLKDSGTDRGKGIIDYLKKNGWKQGIDVRQAVRNYTEGSLKLDLDKLCNGGIYCILDNSTGYFVDHNDYETLKKIYGGSIWQYTDN